MSSTETVVKAKLRVRVDKAGYTGRMLAVLFHANQTMITEMEVTSDWVEFSIDTIVETWAKYTNHIQHDFIVELHSMDNTLLSCNGQANILTESDNRDQQPLLVVYCIEPNYENSPIVKGIRQMLNRQVVTKRQAVVQKRASMKELNTSCSKHTVIVNKEWLNDNMVTNFTIFGPPRIHVDVWWHLQVYSSKQSTSCNHDPPSGDHFQQQRSSTGVTSSVQKMLCTGGVLPC